LCVRLAEDTAVPEPSLRTVLAGIVSKKGTDGGVHQILVYSYQYNYEGFCHAGGGFELATGTSVQESLDRQLEMPPIYEDGNDACGAAGLSLVTPCIQLVVAVCLLAADPSFIQADVLASDRRRFDESSDPSERARLIAKAEKRGVVGWRIGEAYETVPHYRRPHFALFHTGKGRTVPRILPVKGCIVHRDHLAAVPTGHLTDDGREVEGCDSTILNATYPSG
jgi:hypothetical protein